MKNLKGGVSTSVSARGEEAGPTPKRSKRGAISVTSPSPFHVHVPEGAPMVQHCRRCYKHTVACCDICGERYCESCGRVQ